ncbi:hypothetical protein C3B51_23485, partial [Pseudoalteromonas rubra]
KLSVWLSLHLARCFSAFYFVASTPCRWMRIIGKSKLSATPFLKKSEKNGAFGQNTNKKVFFDMFSSRYSPLNKVK